MSQISGGGSGGSSGATTALDNLASTAVNTDILPAADNTQSLGNKDTKRWAEVHAYSKMGIGNTDFVGGGNAALFFQMVGVGGKPSLYWYQGSGNSLAMYISSNQWQFDLGGTNIPLAIDLHGIAGPGRFGKTDSGGNFYVSQIYGALAIAGPQKVTSNADFTVNNGITRVLIKWNAAPAARTITLPATIDDGQVIWFSCDLLSSCAAVTFAGNGKTISATLPAALIAGKGFGISYDSADAAWYRIDGQ